MKASGRNRLVRVAELALETAAGELPADSCPKSPRRFTQPQLLACLVIRAYQKQTYRGVADLLAASDELRGALGLARVPDYSTLQRSADRAVTPDLVDRLLGRLVERVGPAVGDAAMDATGMEPTAASAHYPARSGKARKGYVKLSLVALCGSLLPVGLVVSRGPCNDKREAAELLGRAARKAKPRRLFADEGYDAEWVHQKCRRLGIRSYIPPVVHRRDGTVGGMYRSRMTVLPAGYGKRWHAESFMSGLKRSTGSALASRKANTLDAEASLRVLAYSIRR
ncbi:MAG: transposase [Gemmataceae bacterium]|nr:transposase [Gemmataceae bacterium]